MIFILLFSLALILFESTFLNFPATLLLISFLSLIILDFKKAFLLSFLIAFFYDLLGGGLIGQTGLLFLAISAAAFLYRKKFIQTHLVFEIVFFTFSYKLWQLVKGEEFSWVKLAVIAGLGILMIFWAKRLGWVEAKKEKLLVDKS